VLALAVVMRRGTIPASHHTLDEASGAIRQILARKKMENGVGDLLTRLRDEQKVDEQPQLATGALTEAQARAWEAQQTKTITPERR